MLKHLSDKRNQKGDEGFTLIELMVVVLILGILMAIAIPTFLSTTKSAKGVAGESNATNAATSEISTFSTTGFFDNSQYSGGAALLDPAIPWDTTAAHVSGVNGSVLVLAGGTATSTDAAAFTALANTSATGTGTVMVLESQASNGECFVVVDDQADISAPNVGYYVFNHSGCPTAAPTAPPGAGTPIAGSAAKNADTANLTWPTAWSAYYSNF